MMGLNRASTRKTMPAKSQSPAQSLLIGVPFIDNDHQALLELLDYLLRLEFTDPYSVLMSEVLSRLFGMLSSHFVSEEGFFTTCGMPAEDVNSHIEAHRQILEQYTRLCVDLANKKEMTVADVTRMVREWIIGHVVKHDLKMRDYVHAKSGAEDTSDGAADSA